jgi:hypothetical protein
MCNHPTEGECAMNEIFMSYEQLGVQASRAALERLSSATEAIDRLLGEGAAKQNPALVAALMQATSIEYLALMFSHRIFPTLDEINAGLRDVADALDDSGNG